MELEAAGEKSDDDITLEEKALELAVEETYEATGRRWEPWAFNARSLRIGDIILLVDSDTIVPEVCFTIMILTDQQLIPLIGLLQGCCSRAGRESWGGNHSARVWWINSSYICANTWANRVLG